MHYRIPLIRLIVYLCSYGGLQLKPVDSLGGVVNLLWNLFVSSFVIYALIVQHFERPFINRYCYGENNGSNSNGTSNNNSNHITPLFSLFINSTFSLIRPACFTISIVYYFVAGRRLLALLDSPLFSTVYHSTRQARLIIGCIFFGANFIFVGFWFVNRSYVLAVPAAIASSNIKWTDVALFFFSQYMVNMYQYSVCLVLHYYQHATMLIVQRIDRQLKAVVEEVNSSKQVYKVENHCLQQMMALGRVNARLSRLISVPLMSYIVMNGAQATMSICFALLCTPSFSMLANSLSVWVYLLYMALLNECIKRLVAGVFVMMRKRYQPVEEMMQSKKQQRQMRAFKRIAGKRPWWYTGGVADLPENDAEKEYGRGRRQRRALRLQHADLYQSFFTIKMFHFTWLGLPFIFQVVLFVANYVVLMTQTQ